MVFRKYYFVATLILMFAPVLALAQAPCAPTGPNVIPNPLQYCSIVEIIDSIVRVIFQIAVVLVPLLVLIGAFFLMTSGGDAKRVKTGKNFILWSAVGLAIVLFAKGIIGIIKTAIGIT